MPDALVAEGSIRLGILKAGMEMGQLYALLGCRGLDPIGDTERHQRSQCPNAPDTVAEGSIRLGILKEGGGAETTPTGLALQRARSDWGY